MKTILGFDTSNNHCSVAVMQGENIINFEEQLDPNMQAANIIKMIESVLMNSSLQYQDIDYLAITNGPGSFTGIRIALAVAQGITLASQIKPVIFSNFDTSFYRLKEQVATFDNAIIIINAYRNQIYVQIFDNLGYPSHPMLIDNENVREYILSQSNKKIICAGNGIATIYNHICNIDNLMILPRFVKIKAIHICRLANEIINNGNINSQITPLYIRKPDAKKPAKVSS